MRVVLKPAGLLILLTGIAVLCFFAFNNMELLFGKKANSTPTPVSSAAPASAIRFRPLDLTRIGKTDWVVFGASPSEGTGERKSIEERAVRKQGGTRCISPLEFVGRPPVEYDGDPRAFRWTDGDPNAPTATESRSGLRTDGVGNGFRFKVKPVAGRPNLLKIWCGGSGVRSKLQARMSDGSPLSKMDESNQGVGGGEFRSLYTITFEGNKPDQELIFSYIVADSREGGSVSMQAVAVE